MLLFRGRNMISWIEFTSDQAAAGLLINEAPIDEETPAWAIAWVEPKRICIDGSMRSGINAGSFDEKR